MKQVERTKMCWSCEANVSVEAIFCPFCGTDLLSSHAGEEEGTHTQGDLFSSQNVHDSLASLYKPPYVARNHRGVGVPNEREEIPPYSLTENTQSNTYHRSELNNPTIKNPSIEPEKYHGGGLWPLLLLSIGGNLLTLGLLLFFFSDNGNLHLEWNGNLWFIYCITAIPLLALGWKSLKALSAPKNVEN